MTDGPYREPPPPPESTGIVWKWSYHRWFGIMFGPIPVGVIGVVIILVIYRTR